MSWAAHVKKESLDRAAQNPTNSCCPSDNKWYLPAPGLRCEFISYSNYVEAPKKSYYVDKPVGPNVSIALGGSFFQWGTCLRTAIDLVGPDCPPLHVQSSPDSSRLFSMFTMADSGATASAQRRRRWSDHPRQCLICNESTELAQWPSDTTRQLFCMGSIPADRWKISPNFLPLPLLTCGPPLSSTHTMSNTCQNFVPRFLCFSHTRRCVGILKIAYLFDCASYEDVLCMNVDQHDVNWLVVPFSTMNKTSNMMLSLFEKGVLI